jgi:hypothetical protein
MRRVSAVGATKQILGFTVLAAGLRSTPSKPMSKTRQTRFVKQETIQSVHRTGKRKALSPD